MEKAIDTVKLLLIDRIEHLQRASFFFCGYLCWIKHWLILEKEYKSRKKKKEMKKTKRKQFDKCINRKKNV